MQNYDRHGGEQHVDDYGDALALHVHEMARLGQKTFRDISVRL